MTTQVKPLYPGSEDEPRLVVKRGRVTEHGGAGTITVTVPIPAGAWITNVAAHAVADWTNGTSAALEFGDTADPNGWVAACSLKAGGGMVAGEELSIACVDTLGGVGGAYSAADMIKGRWLATARNVIFTFTTGAGAQTDGITEWLVSYLLPTQDDIIAGVFA